MPRPEISILFVCHGNICRSPMAEFLMKKLTASAGTGISFYIESAATSCEELGNPVYPPVRRLLEAEGIRTDGKTARRIIRDDYRNFDLIIGMDENNLRNMKRFFHEDPQAKFSRLMDWTGCPGDVEDPWYSGNFQKVRQEIETGCRALLVKLLQNPEKYTKKIPPTENGKTTAATM